MITETGGGRTQTLEGTMRNSHAAPGSRVLSTLEMCESGRDMDREHVHYILKG